MKYLMIVAALVGATVTASAFAQSNPSNSQTASAATQMASNTAPAVTQDGQRAPAYGQPIVGKTRAQVYQELVQAKQDGQIEYLDTTVYAGS